MLRRLELKDMEAAARVLRTSFDQALPSLAGLHTPKEDQWFFREHVFNTCEVWGAFDHAAMVGMVAFREDWIDQLYVLQVGRGVGTELLQVAKAVLIACISDVPAQLAGQAFYEARGFALGTAPE